MRPGLRPNVGAHHQNPRPIWCTTLSPRSRQRGRRSRADNRLSELIRLLRRVFHLLQGAQGTRMTGVRPWLLAVRQRIGTRIQAWSVEDLESLIV